MMTRGLNLQMALAILACLGNVGCGLEAASMTDLAIETAAKADSALALDALHFKGNISLTSQVYKMWIGSPNHPGRWEAGVKAGLELLGADAIGISAYRSKDYNLDGTRIELNLSTGVIALKANTPVPRNEAVNPPDQGGDVKAFVGLLLDLREIAQTVSKGSTNQYNPAAPVPELNGVVAYVDSIIASLTHGATLGALVDGKCYAYCPNGFSDDSDYDGWGWANEQSCIVKDYLRDSKNLCFLDASTVPGHDQGLLLEAKLSFDGEISAKAGPSAHTSTYRVRVGRMDYPYGKGFVLFFQEMIPDGACFIHKVFDFDTAELLVTDRFGNPGCDSTQAQPRVLAADDPSYPSEFKSMLGILHRMVDGSYYPTGKPEPSLKPAVFYLDQLASTLP